MRKKQGHPCAQSASHHGPRWPKCRLQHRPPLSSCPLRVDEETRYCPLLASTAQPHPCAVARGGAMLCCLPLHRRFAPASPRPLATTLRPRIALKHYRRRLSGVAANALRARLLDARLVQRGSSPSRDFESGLPSVQRAAFVCLLPSAAGARSAGRPDGEPLQPPFERARLARQSCSSSSAIPPGFVVAWAARLRRTSQC
ncbi:hypothetical protein VFPFJ_04835 [Purpureocillium lilacinum]|uniref:Uncharacterized protein n=1 Tax=Purpureocillium lilacinum TaxID=33203 RepID=A0A179H179_PURLI|nr:hypothetical protein VFPFJ_04835 [Purpureocillium lilacinum]OAQ83894.1 hypothetical protein VFPBJ_02661 [Purpureocillium lilacinum]OAQ90676.1 hypothetical protein VFPFJ_04835 [Purpureocillium lilacinum]